MVIRKSSFSICLVIVFIMSGFFNPVQVKAANVLDCIEGKADCPEINETVPNENENENENDQEKQNSDVASTGSLIFDLVKMVFALLLVLALIYLLLKFLNKRNKLFHQVRALENLGGISVGQNKSIQIVRVGTKVYMIGVGENVEMLHEITDEKIINDLLHKDDATEPQASNLLKSFFQSKSNVSTNSGSQPESKFGKMFSKELDKLKQSRNKIIDQRRQKEDKHD